MKSNSALAETYQSTNTVVMVSPDYFQYNIETAKTNAFQTKNKSIPAKELQDTVIYEFTQAVVKLKKNDLRVITLPSPPNTPDAVFPNNWFSVHAMTNGECVLVLYPMLTPNRRAERQIDVLKKALEERNIVITRIVDFTNYEKNNIALEGTGSMVLDRPNRIAYAALSSRTTEPALTHFTEDMQYKLIPFHSMDEMNQLIYHTNVMMSVGSNFAVICTKSISNKIEREHVIAHLNMTGKNIIDISMRQMREMAGNILELRSTKNERLIVLSSTALAAFTAQQTQELAKYGKLLPIDIKTIETIGGGSVRCMLAEIFY